MTWSDSFCAVCKDSDVRLVTHVPDNLLTPLIAGAAADIISCRWPRHAKTRRSAPWPALIWAGCAARW